MYTLISTMDGDATLHELADKRTLGEEGLNDSLDHMAQFLTVLIKCGSCSFYTAENDGLIMEIKLAETSWIH